MSDDAFEVPEHPCPHCGAMTNRVGRIPGQSFRRPRPGDVGVCILCGEPYAFTEDAPRKLTDEEHEELSKDPRFLVVKRAIHRAKSEVN